MARADLLIDLVKAGAKGDRVLFRKALEALIADERAKQHHVLARRLAGYLQEISKSSSSTSLQNGFNSEMFFELTPQRSLEELVLPNVVRQACKELIEEQNRADLLRAHNLEPRHRILLVGPPGNGKTSLAEAIATELAVPFLVVRYESIITSFLGETAVRLSRLFEQVRTRRCVLFFDEFDVLGKERGDIYDTGEIKRVVSSLLLQIDVLQSYVVVITATNHPELLDRAVWRRFQLRLYLPPPSLKDIEEWFYMFEKRSGISLGTKLIKNIASKLKGLSFSEIEQFAMDIQRRYILSLPDADIKRIVRERLKQWERRFPINLPSTEMESGRETE